MSNTRNLVRGLATVTAGLALAIPFAASPAQAEPITFNVDATATFKTAKTTVVLPTGTLNADVNRATGKLTGNLALPNASKRISFSSIPLADVTVAFHQAAPVTGTFDTTAGKASTKATFNVQVVGIRPAFAPQLNLVQGSCTTKAPTTVSLSGPINLGGVSSFSGGFDLADFGSCGNKLVDKAISAALSGSGNTMTAKLS